MAGFSFSRREGESFTVGDALIIIDEVERNGARRVGVRVIAPADIGIRRTPIEEDRQRNVAEQLERERAERRR